MTPSLTDAIAYVGGASPLDDARVQGILSGVLLEVESFLGTPLVQEMKTQEFDAGQGVWFTDYRPVASVTSILDPAGNEITSDDFLLKGELGQICFYSYARRAVDSSGKASRWTATYVAGLYASAALVPADVALGILDLVAVHYHRPEPDIQSVRTIDQGVAYIPNPNGTFILPPRVQQLLGPKVRRQVF